MNYDDDVALEPTGFWSNAIVALAASVIFLLIVAREMVAMLFERAT